MPEWVKKELRSNFARASRAGRRAARTEPRAARASYRTKDDARRIELTNGAAITVPVNLIPALKRAAPSDVRLVEVLGRGGGLHWESLDLDLSVPALVSSVFAGPEWMGELARVGGRRSSAAKAAPARRNGRKGGRPRSRAVSGTSAQELRRWTPDKALLPIAASASSGLSGNVSECRCFSCLSYWSPWLASCWVCWR